MYLTYDGEKMTVVSESGKRETWSTDELAAMPFDWQPVIADMKDKYAKAGKPVTERYIIRPYSS